MTNQIATALTLGFLALLSLIVPCAAAEPCLPGWTLDPSGKACVPPGGCSESKAVLCTGTCSYCSGGIFGGPRPGETVPPCTAKGCPHTGGGTVDWVCTCCLRYANCGIGSGTLGKHKKSTPSPDAIQKLPQADPCPPKCEVSPDRLKRYQRTQ